MNFGLCNMYSIDIKCSEYVWMDVWMDGMGDGVE